MSISFEMNQREIGACTRRTRTHACHIAEIDHIPKKKQDPQTRGKASLRVSGFGLKSEIRFVKQYERINSSHAGPKPRFMQSTRQNQVLPQICKTVKMTTCSQNLVILAILTELLYIL